MGAGAVSTAASARWLVYVDRFAGLVGPAPGPRSFDLYGRSYLSAPPENLGFTGNRVVYNERPTLTLTGAALSKTYGETILFGAGLPGFAAAGYRPGNSAATALNGAPLVASAGAASGAGVLGGPYAVTVAARRLGPGLPAGARPRHAGRAPRASLIRVDDQTRLYGAADPRLTWTTTSVDGETAAVLTGAPTTTATRG